ncbi:hypothetical protein [uncultured Paracoccus sp.]|uniref:hypothetical protein n=1 Tax=uncultured Paracoccus sp. TaxID=189685 RepID=UPI002623B515|nr:hypothetical protein [uncultured Paracoccus sp.]
MKLAIRVLCAIVVVFITLLTIHAEYLGFANPAAAIYAPSALAKLLLAVVLAAVLLAAPRTVTGGLTVVAAAAIWALQHQAIVTTSVNEPPVVETRLFGQIIIDQKYVCVAPSADDLFLVPGQSITQTLRNVPMSDADCRPADQLFYLALAPVVVFAPVQSDALRKAISNAIDAAVLE